MRYAFIQQHEEEQEHSVRRMFKVMQFHPSGYYVWRATSQSPHAKDDQRLLGLKIQYDSGQTVTATFTKDYCNREVMAWRNWKKRTAKRAGARDAH